MKKIVVLFVVIACIAYGKKKPEPVVVLQQTYDATTEQVYVVMLQAGSETGQLMCTGSNDGKTSVTIRATKPIGRIGDGNYVVRIISAFWSSMDSALSVVVPATK